MAVDNVSGVSFNPLIALLTRASFEATLARFNEQVSQFSPDVIRERLKARLGEVDVNINRRHEDVS